MAINKNAFAERFFFALERAGFPRPGKGLQGALAKEFKVTQASVSQWLRGDSLPEVEKLLEIAKRLEVPMEWLLEGSGKSFKKQGLLARAKKSKSVRT